MTKDILIKVTQEDIDEGVPRTGNCPVALALLNCGFTDVRVGKVSMSFTGFEPDKFVDRVHSTRLKKAIAKFDKGEVIKPFAFKLTGIEVDVSNV